MTYNAASLMGVLIGLLFVGVVGIYTGQFLIDSMDMNSTTTTNNLSEWTQQNASSGWDIRYLHAAVTTPTDHIILSGGLAAGSPFNDTWQSTDKGVTWELMNVSSGWEARSDQSMVRLPNGHILLLCGRSLGLALEYNDTWRSTDEGSTWELMNATPEFGQRYIQSAVALSDGSIVLIGGKSDLESVLYSDVWRSIDEGVTWTQQNTSAWTDVSIGSPTRAVVLSDDTIVVAGVSYAEVWQSTDKGITWTQNSVISPWAYRDKSVVVKTTDDKILLIGGDSGSDLYTDIWQTTDRGVSWANITDIVTYGKRVYAPIVMTSDNHAVLLGGTDNANNYNDVWITSFESTSNINPSLIDSRNDIINTVTIGITMIKLAIVVIIGTMVFVILQKSGLIPKFGDE
jgi:hypothetical protein